MLKVLRIRQLICLQTLPIKASRGRQATTTVLVALVRRRSARMLIVRHQLLISILDLYLARRQSTLFRIGVFGGLLSQALTRSSGTPRYIPSLLCLVTAKKQRVTLTANRSSMVHAGDLPLYLVFRMTVIFSQSGHGTRLIPDGSITGAHVVVTPDYIQITGGYIL
jgi:hypothetical protein